MALLTTIWSKVTTIWSSNVTGGENAHPHFQNPDDAYMQVHCKLESFLHKFPSHKWLFILDDVWSKDVLEKLTFNIPGVWTLVTTRQAALLETIGTQTYMLELLDQENARRLFCNWTFGLQHIPSWADEALVEAVISECKGLPLALRVIGGSLSSVARLPQAWRRTIDKLRQAELLGQDQQNLLVHRLKTSVSALDSQLRNCFMDLGAFPEDSQIPVDNLLDIWVHVRRMDWDDAYLSLIELASRCLLDLDIHKRRTEPSFSSSQDHTTNYGYGKSLTFSQHDVLRDMAIQLGRENTAVDQRRWLLMPQRQANVPMEWQSGRSLAAQVISISTGGTMTAQDWPSIHFPHGEALLLDLHNVKDGSELPHFVRNMSKLKVLIVRYSGGKNWRPSLRGLRCLQSLYIDAGDTDIHITSDRPSGRRWLRSRASNSNSCRGLWRSSCLCTAIASNSTTVRNVDHVNRSMPKMLTMMKKMMIRGGSVRLDDDVLTNLSTSLEILSLEVGMDTMRTVILRRLFKNLKVLDISGFPSNPWALPMDMGSAFKMLRCVNLSHCWTLTSLPASICELTNLEVLQIYGCHSLKDLPTNIGQLQCLRRLVVDAANMLDALPESLVSPPLRHLETLILARCRSLKRLPHGMGQLQSLKEIYLGAPQLQEIPESLTELRNLESLTLANCSSFRRLDIDIGNLRCLKFLSLRGASKLEELPESLVKLRNLEILNLAHCGSLRHLPDDISQLECLKKLYLQDASELKTLPESMVGLKHLEKLNLDGCSSLKHFPLGILQQQLPSLKIFGLKLQGGYSYLPYTE